MDLIKPTDPQYFKQTSDLPYDRHKYKIVFKDGRSILLNNYDEMRGVWFEYVRNWGDAKVEVLDNNTQPKGFKNSTGE